MGAESISSCGTARGRTAVARACTGSAARRQATWSAVSSGSIRSRRIASGIPTWPRRPTSMSSSGSARTRTAQATASSGTWCPGNVTRSGTQIIAALDLLVLDLEEIVEEVFPDDHVPAHASRETIALADHLLDF